MNRRKIIPLLWTAAALLGGAAVSAVVLGVMLPLDGADAVIPTPRPTRSIEPDLPPLQAFASVWRMDLQRPLQDVAATAAPLGIKLVGTVDEPGRSMAMIGLRSGSIELKAVGEAIDDPAGPIRIVKIEPSAVTIEHAGTTAVLKLQSDETH